ncbi:hypothetical protein ACLOJK_014608 [Asimina triloba]
MPEEGQLVFKVASLRELPFHIIVAPKFGKVLPLIYKSERGYAVFSTREDVKAIDNPHDHVPGWESMFFFAQLLSERDTWAIPEQWEEPLLDPIPRSYVRLSASRQWTLMYFRGTALRWHPSREVFFH